MNHGDWKEIYTLINKEIQEIFKNYNYANLTKLEKRKIIFEYLCENISYDHILYKDIKDFKENNKRVSRNSYQELENVIYYKIGICNAISQYYKLLLEQAGIISYCVICDDETNIRHQLNLVYDEQQDSFSFDDITCVILKKGNQETYFGYDLQQANNLGQGNKTIMNEQKWFILPEDYINYLVGRINSNIVTVDTLPKNITSINNKFKNRK